MRLTCNLTFVVSSGNVKMSATQAAAPAVKSWTDNGGIFSGLTRRPETIFVPDVATADEDVVVVVAIVFSFIINKRMLFFLLFFQ